MSNRLRGDRCVLGAAQRILLVDPPRANNKKKLQNIQIYVNLCIQNKPFARVDCLEVRPFYKVNQLCLGKKPKPRG